MSASLLSAVRKALPDINVDDHPYDIGYWARVAKFSRSRCPRSVDGRRGWDIADKELADEASEGAAATTGGQS